MTVQEAIEILEKPSDHIKTIHIKDKGKVVCREEIVYSAELVQTFEMAIKALETMAEMKKRNISTETILEYAKFEDECVQKGFTFKSLLEAREKQTENKVDTTGNDDMDFYICPVCKNELISMDDYCSENDPYCSNCGQKLDWGD